MLNLVYLKNPGSFEIYKATANDYKSRTWKVAEIKRFPSPTGILYGNIIEYAENKNSCSEKDIKETEEFTVNDVINTILK